MIFLCTPSSFGVFRTYEFWRTQGAIAAFTCNRTIVRQPLLHEYTKNRCGRCTCRDWLVQVIATLLKPNTKLFYCAGKTSGSSFKPLNAFYFMQAQHAVHPIDNAMKRPMFPGQIQLDDIGTKPVPVSE